MEERLLRRKYNAEVENNSTLVATICADLADLYIQEGRYELAIKEYEVLANFYKSERKPIHYAKVHRGIGEAYMGLHDFERALTHENIYLDISKRENDVLEQQRALATIGHTYLTRYLETREDRDETLYAAFKYFKESLAIARNLNEINETEKADMMARVYSNLGLVEDYLGEHKAAIEFFDESIQLCKEHDLYEQLTRSYISVAAMYEKKEEYHNAICQYNFAIKSGKKLKDRVDLMCAVLLAKSEMFIKLGEFYNAKKVLFTAYKLKTPNLQERSEIERKLRIVVTLCYTEDKLLVVCEDKELKKLHEKMGDGACELKVYSKAIEHYKLMLEYAKMSYYTSRQDLASCYYSLAETYKDNGQYIEAVEYYEKEYALSDDLKDNLNTLSKIADTKEEAEASVNEVKAVYKRALNICRKNLDLKEEARMVCRFIEYLKRINSESDVSQWTEYLDTLGPQNLEDGWSLSDYDLEEKVNFGDDINLNDITDESDGSGTDLSDVPEESDVLSDFENQEFIINAGLMKKKHLLKKNKKGESRLHVACIKGTESIVRSLVDMGHPIDIRDNFGWSPLHEACNYGHLKIVKFLLEKGADVNDKRGKFCKGVTPLYDAAHNGHLKVVKLLLDKGAFAASKTDSGDYALNALKNWHYKNPFREDDLTLYLSLVKRLSKVMKEMNIKLEVLKVKGPSIRTPGQKLKAATLVSPPLSERPGKEAVVQTPALPKNLSRLLYSDDEDDDDDDDADNNTAELLKCDEAKEYLNVMETLKNKAKYISASSTTHFHPVSERPALNALIDDEDWLEDDMPHTKPAKKRKINPIAATILSTYTSKDKPTEASRTTPATSPINRTLGSLLGTGSSKTGSKTHILGSFGGRNKGKSSGSSLKRTRRGVNEEEANNLASTTGNFSTYVSNDNPISVGTNPGTSGLNRINLDPLWNADASDINILNDSPISSNTLKKDRTGLHEETRRLITYVDVKIQDKVFSIAVFLFRLQSLTIGWLAQQVLKRYAGNKSIKPTLELETNTGVLLSDDDPLSLLFPLGSLQAETVVAKLPEYYYD